MLICAVEQAAGRGAGWVTAAVLNHPRGVETNNQPSKEEPEGLNGPVPLRTLPWPRGEDAPGNTASPSGGLGHARGHFVTHG